jgi:hypothetical protein
MISCSFAENAGDLSLSFFTRCCLCGSIPNIKRIKPIIGARWTGDR